MKKLILSVGLALVCSPVLAQDVARNIEVSKNEFGKEWPFTVESGQLSCFRFGRSTAVVFNPGTRRYGLNGMAQSRLDLPEPHPIWKDDPNIPGIKVSIGSMISKGLALCE